MTDSLGFDAGFYSINTLSTAGSLVARDVFTQLTKLMKKQN